MFCGPENKVSSLDTDKSKAQELNWTDYDLQTKNRENLFTKNKSRAFRIYYSAGKTVKDAEIIITSLQTNLGADGSTELKCELGVTAHLD